MQAKIDSMLAEIATYGTDDREPLCTVEQDEDTWIVGYADHDQYCESIEEAADAVQECLDTLRAIPKELIVSCKEGGINPLHIEWGPGAEFLDALMGMDEED
jgi:hypothetical protein